MADLRTWIGGLVGRNRGPRRDAGSSRSDPATSEPSRASGPARRWTATKTASGLVYSGHFTARRPAAGGVCAVPGRIVVEQGRPPQVFARGLPPEVFAHPDGVCWQLADRRSGWLRLHWTVPPSDFHGARLYVLRMLNESFRIAGRNAGAEAASGAP